MRKNISKNAVLYIISLFTLLPLLLSCGREQLKSINVKRNFTGALWVVRHNISDKRSIDYLLKTAEKTGVKNLFIQIRGRGDAYYSSTIEPAATDVTPGFDPLAYIIKKTRGTDIRIHAWVNISFVLDPENYPPESKHVLSRHPEWITYDYKGRPMTDYSAAELKENLLEGYCLDPAIPEVREYTSLIIRDIITRYQVDGIHLDFIRYPYSGYNSYYNKYLSDFGYNPIARKIFKKKYGIDPIKINRYKESAYRRLFDKFRVDQISNIVGLIHKTVKEHNPYLLLSAAVMPRHDWGKRVYFQDWPTWLEKGIIDIACVMSYTTNKETYSDFIDYASETGKKQKILMGVRIDHEKTPGLTAIEQIEAAYSHGFKGFIIFSFKHDRNYLNRIFNSLEYERNIYRFSH